MSDTEKNKETPLKTHWQDLFSLHFDQAHPDMIDNAIRRNVRVSGTNLWVLMFAIAIASIGLNVNSTAVIIGAMLISPLMSPIVGMGYGAAVGDVALIRLSIRNMFIFIALSLFTSTLYFLITPLEQAQSELLARTTPTLWDVLIAFFGGSAGIIALTRKEGSNVVPGVAIATALMPPLCTAGFGLAHSNWDYFFGAFYLFSINCVFIAFATLLFSKVLNLPRRGLVTESVRRFQRMVITLIVVVVMLPSGFLAMQLVQKELFNTTVNTAIQKIQEEAGFYVLRTTTDHKNKTVGLIINGSGDGQAITEKLTDTLITLGISEPNVTVLYAGGNLTNINALKQEFESLKNSEQSITPKQPDYLDNIIKKQQETQDVIQEILAQYPDMHAIHIADGVYWQNPANLQTTDDDNSNNQDTHQDNLSQQTAKQSLSEKHNPFKTATLVVIHHSDKLSDKEHARLLAWLKRRLHDDKLMLNIVIAKPHDEPKKLDDNTTNKTAN